MSNEVAATGNNKVSVSNETTALMSMIERVVANPEADIEKLEKMLDMQERVINRNAMEAFNTGMAAMQSEMPSIERKTSGHNYNYASFEHINERVKPTMQKHGFAISFRVKNEPSVIHVTGVLMHKNGHREETEITLPADTSGSKNAVQAVGSAVSYGKRYVLCALLNISTHGEDDDAMQLTDTVSTDQVTALNDLIKETGVSNVAFCDHFKITSVEGLPAKSYNMAAGMLERKRSAK